MLTQYRFIVYKSKDDFDCIVFDCMAEDLYDATEKCRAMYPDAYNVFEDNESEG